MNQTSHASMTQDARAVEELAKVVTVGSIGIALLTLSFWAMWTATPW